MITSTGSPFNRVGLYFHCTMASSAAFTNRGLPRTNWRFSMLPVLLMVAVNSTMPCTRVIVAMGG